MKKREQKILFKTILEINKILDLEAKGWMSPKGMRAEAVAIKNLLANLIYTLDQERRK